MNLRVLALAMTASALLSTVVGGVSDAATPHDPYIYWLPSGSADGASFTVKLRQTRMGVPDADLVLVRGTTAPVTVTVGGKDMPAPWTSRFYVIPSTELAGKNELAVSLDAPVGPCRFYLTNDLRVIPADYRPAYDAAVGLELADDWKRARASFAALAAKDPSGALGRFSRQHARRAAYKLKSAQSGLSAKSHYWLGMYCMENSFWEDAVHEFEQATKLAPTDADSWYMLADSRAYRDGDLGDQVEPLVPIYRKSAELRDVKDPNVWTNYVGIFRRMWVNADDGKGGKIRKLMVMPDATVERIKKEWAWRSDIFWAASRGSLKQNDIVRVFDEEYDNTDPHAFDKLWKPGEVDTFMKFFEGGPAEALGHDCGPNRTAVVDIGTWCGWEVYLHEWNHTLDWSILTSENGKGVPVTHSSDWCGFQPIPSMGRGHASCNHYYMTPGMLRAVKGAEVDRPGYNENWLIYGPYECEPNKGLDTVFAPETDTQIRPAMRASSDGSPWFDLKNALKPKSESVVAYASAYVYSPTRQKARMWLGMNDGIKVWVNGRVAYGGIYKAIVLWDEANEPDQVVPTVMLEKGWNSVLVKVENLPKTPEQLEAVNRTENGWGFSVRMCGLHNEALAGVKWSAEKPAGWKLPHVTPNAADGKLYRWSDVKDDYTTLLPCLTEKDLAAHTGLSGLSITKDSLITAPGAPKLQPWVSSYDQDDHQLNNLLNWRFESAAVLRYTKGGKSHDLVLLRPEAYDTYIRLMRVPKGRGIKSHADRVLGYTLIRGLDDCPNGRVMLVLDTYLGDKLPADEKELLDISQL